MKFGGICGLLDKIVRSGAFLSKAELKKVIKTIRKTKEPLILLRLE